MHTLTWSTVHALVRTIGDTRPRGSRRFADRVIVLTMLWAAWNHKPISWAVCRTHWPIWAQRLLPCLPSSTTMSRRLRSASVRAFLDDLLAHAQGRLASTLVQLMDATALFVRPHSKDRQATFGFGGGARGKGYKVHVLLHLSGKITGWRVTPMGTHDSLGARRILRAGPPVSYVVADGAYDANTLHRYVSSCGGQLVTPRRRGVKGLGHIRHAEGRLRSVEMIESLFGQKLLHTRGQVERFFGHTDTHAHGLGELPAWVRTHVRVRNWVHAKLILNALRLDTLQAHNAQSDAA